MSKPEKASEKESELSFGNLEFEEVLGDLLQIKPVENVELKKDVLKPKKKSKPKTKK